VRQFIVIKQLAKASNIDQQIMETWDRMELFRTFTESLNPNLLQILVSRDFTIESLLAIGRNIQASKQGCYANIISSKVTSRFSMYIGGAGGLYQKNETQSFSGLRRRIRDHELEISRGPNDE